MLRSQQIWVHVRCCGDSATIVTEDMRVDMFGCVGDRLITSSLAQRTGIRQGRSPARWPTEVLELYFFKR